MTKKEYEEKLLAQDGKCITCGNPQRPHAHNKGWLVVDHNHKTNEIRDLLCDRCNLIVGLCDESDEVLASIGSYLRKHNDPG